MELKLDLSHFNPLVVPKIKLVHLLLDPGHNEDIEPSVWYKRMETQADSILKWHPVGKLMGNHSPRYSKLNRTELPVENCADPSIINTSKDFKGGGLSYGHYGAYLSHSDAILSEFTDDLDAILVVEGDVHFNIEPSRMYKEIVNAYNFASRNNGAMVTFGEVRFGLNHSHDPAELIQDWGDYNKIPHFLCAHCYLILKSERRRIKDKILNSKWHAWDIWMYWNYDSDNSVNIFSTKSPLVFEPDGISMIDYQEKSNNLKL